MDCLETLGCVIVFSVSSSVGPVAAAEVSIEEVTLFSGGKEVSLFAARFLAADSAFRFLRAVWAIRG